MSELRRFNPDLRLINLETAIATSEDYWPDKGINYRMHPLNTPCLNAAGIDACGLSNNHVMDWGYEGLRQTLSSLKAYGIGFVGAGLNRSQAEAPLIFPFPDKGRLLVYACAHRSSGVPSAWRAGISQPGIALVKSLDISVIRCLADDITARRKIGDMVLVSIHWGGNWGYEIPWEQRRFAHWLIDEAGVNIVHGHSSHHPKGIEVYHGSPIFYGRGDFMNDYEEIGGCEDYRDDLTMAYFLTLSLKVGSVTRVVMSPLKLEKFRLN